MRSYTVICVAFIEFAIVFLCRSMIEGQFYCLSSSDALRTHLFEIFIRMFSHHSQKCIGTTFCFYPLEQFAVFFGRSSEEIENNFPLMFGVYLCTLSHGDMTAVRKNYNKLFKLKI